MNSAKCPVCKTEAAVTAKPESVRTATVECRVCRVFDLPRTTQISVVDGLADRDRIILSNWLRHEPRGEGPLVLDDGLVRKVVREHHLPLPDEWDDNLIVAMGETQSKALEREFLLLDLRECAAEIGAPSEDLVYRTVLRLVEENILEGPVNIRHVQVGLTKMGWRKYKELLQTPEIRSPEDMSDRQAPVIMNIHATNFSGIAATSVSGTTSITSTQNADPSKGSAPTSEIEDKWVDSDYPNKLGVVQKLTADGYLVNWKSASEEATCVDIEGWKHVLIDQNDGTRARLKIRDGTPTLGGYLVLLMKRAPHK